MAKVITVTANTAIDNIIEIENFTVGKVFRAKRSMRFPTGKGVNVARVVETLKQPVIVLGFVGQTSHASFRSLDTALLQVHLTEVPGDTRTNITILDAAQGSETHIQDIGFLVQSEDIDELIETLRRAVSPGDLVTFSGSLPPGLDASTYKSLIGLCHQMEVLTILDSSNEELSEGLRAQPYMIKPNQKELEELAGRNLNSEADLIAAAREIASSGIPLVVVSRGAKGALVIERNGPVWKGSVQVDKPVIMTVGSGDALVAGFATGLLEKRTLLDTIRLGIACGAANVLTLGPGVCLLDDIERLVPHVKVEEYQGEKWRDVA